MRFRNVMAAALAGLLAACAAKDDWAIACKPFTPEQWDREVSTRHNRPYDRKDGKKGKPQDGIDRHAAAKAHFVYAVLSWNVYGFGSTLTRTGEQPPEPIKYPLSMRKLCDGCWIADTHDHGFTAQSYLLEIPSGETQIVVVFKGTNSAYDWIYGNFSSGQYETARRYAGQLFAALEKEKLASNGVPKHPIVATGHSLGGGLAEHLAFCYPHWNIKAVSFNTSHRHRKEHCTEGANEPEPRDARVPDEATEDMVRKTRIVRLHQAGEILSIVRRVSRLITESDYDDNKFFEADTNWITLHGMLRFSMGLIKFAGCPVEHSGLKSTADPRAAETYSKNCGKPLSCKPLAEQQ